MSRPRAPVIAALKVFGRKIQNGRIIQRPRHRIPGPHHRHRDRRLASHGGHGLVLHQADASLLVEHVQAALEQGNGRLTVIHTGNELGPLHRPVHEGGHQAQAAMHPAEKMDRPVEQFD
ncbi:hypothetical protein [Desulfosarcina alkanivorans]|uniref:hypothetical protein n=1 Tax=Desulfosarcina alkanivorans TaxID=571177 RepID=UPI001E4D8829|nr:hypothetical protein [Desulfosarcina alkanivorans]